MVGNNDTRLSRLFLCVNYILLAGLGILTLYPFLYFLGYSLNDGIDSARGGIYLIPRIFTFDNYLSAFKNPNILNAMGISIFRTVVGTLISLAATTALAFALTDKKLPGRTQITLFFFFTTIFSGGVIPQYILLRQLGLTKSIWIYVIPVIYNFLNFVVMRTFFESIPESLSESATIDGCNTLQIFYRIFLPLSGPALATIALFFGVAHWNDWFIGAFYISNKSRIPAASLLQKILTEASFESSGGNNAMQGPASTIKTAATTPQALRMTFIVITTLPIVCVYPFLQKYFVKGALIGSVKG